MTFKPALIGIVMTSMLCASRQMTSDEIDNAYARASTFLSEKIPANSSIAGIESTSMSPDWGRTVKVNMVVDTQKPYGIVRSYYGVKVTSVGDDYRGSIFYTGGEGSRSGFDGAHVNVNLGLILNLNSRKKRK
jgi:hypothetical protein